MLPTRRSNRRHWISSGSQRIWLRLAPGAGLRCTLATWLHFWLSGGLRLQEYPRSSALTQSSLLAAAGLVLLGLSCYALYRTAEATQLKLVLTSALVLHVCLLFALPLYSTDMFTYLLYGEMAARGLDVHTLGPSALGDSTLVALTTWK